MTHPNVWHYSFICATWLIHVVDMTHSYVRRDFFICVTWFICMCGTRSWQKDVVCMDPPSVCVWPDSFICVTWLIHMRDWTRSYVRHDSFICAPLLIHMCAMTHSEVCHDTFICAPWLLHMCAMTHSYVWHAWSVWVTRPMPSCVGTHHICDTIYNTLQHTATHCNTLGTHSHMWCDSYIRVTELLLQRDTPSVERHIGIYIYICMYIYRDLPPAERHSFCTERCRETYRNTYLNIYVYIETLLLQKEMQRDI